MTVTTTATAPTTAPKAANKAKAGNATKAHHGSDKMPHGRGGKVEKHVFTPRTTAIKGRAGDLPAPREGSKRADLLETLLDKGMTIPQMEKKFDWKPRDCMDALRLLGKQNGVSLELKDDGRWHAKKR